MNDLKKGRLRVNGTHLLPLLRDVVWEALNNPEILQQCIKGCETVERIDSNHFEAVFKLRVGPIKRQFNARLEIEDDQVPEKYILTANLNAGMVGNVSGKTRVILKEEQGRTLLKYDADIEISGWFKSVGAVLLSEVADRYMQRFIDKLVDIVKSREN